MLKLVALSKTIESDLCGQLYVPILDFVKKRARDKQRYFAYTRSPLTVSTFSANYNSTKKSRVCLNFHDLNDACSYALDFLEHAVGTEFEDSKTITKFRYDIISATALITSIPKKFVESDEGRKANDDAAIELFVKMNRRNRGLDTYSSCSYVKATVDRATQFLHEWYARPSITEAGVPMPGFGDGDLWCPVNTVGQHGRFGPGASIGTRSTAFVEKIGDSVLTATHQALYDWYYRTTLSSRICHTAEISRLKRHGFRIVDSSVITCVPKSQNISRTICTEPSLNMFFQLGLGKMMSDRLRECTGIDLDRQPDRNKEMARIGSVSGAFATIDLKSASDTVSLRLCRRMLPPSLFKLMLDLRCRKTRLPNGQYEDLAMMSTMGNGFTFPLQTALFASLVMGAYATCGIKIKRPYWNGAGKTSFIGNFGVFGDDLVVDTRVYEHLCKVLDSLGFIVNLDKSFNCGKFRESCGGDYFNGCHVRGVYIQSLATKHDLFSVLNRLVRWSAKHTYLPETVKALWKKCDKRFIVPPSEDMSRGLQVPYFIARNCNIARSRSGLMMYRYLAMDSKQRRTTRLEKSNPAAVLKAMLRGDVVDARYTVRSSGPIDVTSRKAVVPNWDYLPAHIQIMYEGTSEAWEHAWYFYSEIVGVPRLTT